MKSRFLFKSIYVRFVVVFLGIWWSLLAMTYGMVMKIMYGSVFARRMAVRTDQFDEFQRIMRMTRFCFIASAVVGTILILFAVRGVVRPIKRLSKAAKEIARGNFETYVEPESRDEVGQLTTDFNNMAQELKGIDILHKDFVANVSHEFKTPITSIMGYANLIRDGELPMDQLKEYGEIVASESQRLSLLASNLLKLSELDSHLIREQAAAFSLDEQLRKTVLLLEVQWKKKEIAFEMDLEPASVEADKNLLQEVWLNLIQNAIKFSHPGGTIKIGLHTQDGQIRVDVVDFGIGIREEDKARVFERFFKGEKSHFQEGNGLGLVIAKRIVEMSNGHISFVSTAGQGSTFSVELPNK